MRKYTCDSVYAALDALTTCIDARSAVAGIYQMMNSEPATMAWFLLLVARRAGPGPVREHLIREAKNIARTQWGRKDSGQGGYYYATAVPERCAFRKIEKGKWRL